jgi:hypothetical protein
MLEKEGYLTATREVRITAAQVSSVEVSLDPVPVSTTQAAGLVPATAGAFCVILLGVAYRCHQRQ